MQFKKHNSGHSKISWLRRDSDDSAKVVPVKEGWIALEQDDDDNFKQFFKIKSSNMKEWEELK